MGFLIDTNILSEVQKGKRADSGVKSWYDNCDTKPRVRLDIQTFLHNSNSSRITSRKTVVGCARVYGAHHEPGAHPTTYFSGLADIRLRVLDMGSTPIPIFQKM